MGCQNDFDVEAQLPSTSSHGNIPLASSTYDSYLKTVNLTLNGRPLQSMTSEQATEDESFAHYFQFLKTTGCCFSGTLHNGKYFFDSALYRVARFEFHAILDYARLIVILSLFIIVIRKSVFINII